MSDRNVFQITIAAQRVSTLYWQWFGDDHKTRINLALTIFGGFVFFFFLLICITGQQLNDTCQSAYNHVWVNNDFCMPGFVWQYFCLRNASSKKPINCFHPLFLYNSLYLCSPSWWGAAGHKLFVTGFTLLWVRVCSVTPHGTKQT